MSFSHYPVMLSEVIGNLNIKPGGIYVDGTLGGAGHSSVICKNLSKEGVLIAIDQDEEAIKASSERLKDSENRVIIERANYSEFLSILNKHNIANIDGILLDLGVSSYQLDTADRGFTYRSNAPLDMRMDQRMERTAKDIVNTYSEMELFRIIRDYGEDRFAKNIAKHIVMAREEKEIETTFELNDIIEASIPKKVRMTGGHPSKRTFQALRIELNDELGVLKNTLEDMVKSLNPGGRMCVITFHSLEDRIVKNCFKTLENPCICPPNFPVCTCGRKPIGRVITRKPILPTEKELEENSRSKSAKLRVIERI
ncbi:MAG: 16S rRNA (cytosine(1402)-N(4))-methyltransferase RsmH [Lachnospiraceae bacterium]|nr:16S rRNA (cytosine(1402)-N(4))-methyltransferase RsmH [Lachnospiraceae bacterium]